MASAEWVGMRKLLIFVLIFLSVPALSDPEADVGKVLDDFHKAASQADGPRYFGHFAKEGIFLGTDITERWTVAQFKAYAEPHFSRGKGWTYVPVSRHTYLAPDGTTAWFDEILKNEKYGMTRGSGVLVQQDGEWKVAQYHLTLPVPNDLIDDLVKMIESQ